MHCTWIAVVTFGKKKPGRRSVNGIIIRFALVVYEAIITNSTLRTSLVIHSLILNACSSRNCQILLKIAKLHDVSSSQIIASNIAKLASLHVYIPQWNDQPYNTGFRAYLDNLKRRPASIIIIEGRSVDSANVLSLLVGPNYRNAAPGITWNIQGLLFQSLVTWLHNVFTLNLDTLKSCMIKALGIKIFSVHQWPLQSVGGK